MKYYFKVILISLLTLTCLTVLPNDELLAQCPMCKMSAESNLKSGGAQGEGLNAGILFILSLPYLIVGSIGYAWWRNNRYVDLDEN